MKGKMRNNVWAIIIGSVVIFFICYFSLTEKTGNRSNIPKASNAIRETEAVTLCQDYYEKLYENSTGLDVKIGIFSDYQVAENIDTWILTVFGKCQNAFGVWIKVPARCQVRKKSVTEIYFDYANIVDFKYER